MGSIILVTGGARSGKSTFAENKAKELSMSGTASMETQRNVMYIATSVPFDDEMRERVRMHKQRRPESWLTYEGYRHLSDVYEGNEQFSVILLDCITVMVTNLIFDEIGDDFENLSNQDVDKLEHAVFREISDFISAAQQHSQSVVIVTNEVGLGLVPENKLGRIFRDIAGRMNQFIAAKADEVYLAVCGIPMKIK